MTVLVLNSGSSSLKFALVEPDTGKRALDGIAERIGGEDATLTTHTILGDKETVALPRSSHEAVLHEVLDRLDRLARAGLHRQIEGIGHRVVHGGEEFTESVLITDRVEASILAAARLAPLHNPANLEGIRAARAAFPHVPQVAVFDTAFHQTMHPRAFRYAVPESWYQDHGVRKYGFHGTSYRYVAEQSARKLERPESEAQLLIAHLGNGCSACAVRCGKSADTTMGFTPLPGLVMGTRSGDVDPSLVAYMAGQRAVDADAVTRELNERSGLLGLSGLSNDMRTLLEARSQGNARAALAIELFCYRLASWLLALCASLERLDALVFTGGIGEHAAAIRAEVVARLWPLGARLDPDANDRHGAPTGRISAEGSVPVWVVATDEEHMIALDTRRLTQPPGRPSAIVR
ncbi:MAG TPA: acetate kinase [Polyangiaceae bacterium]|nr:acetate kinase [Polyangiaceae bacterium]